VKWGVTSSIAAWTFLILYVQYISVHYITLDRRYGIMFPFLDWWNQVHSRAHAPAHEHKHTQAHTNTSTHKHTRTQRDDTACGLVLFVRGQ
jgi:hypothetical protein